MLVVGSNAMIQAGMVLGRPPVDYDYICTIDEYEDIVRRKKNSITRAVPNGLRYMHIRMKDGFNYEFEIAWEGSTAAEILARHEGDGYATLPELLMMKMSHRYLRNSPHFLKTRQDILSLRARGVVLDKGLTSILKRREKETYTYGHPNLSQSKANFFNDAVQYIHSHDSIHEAIAFGTKPAYKYFSVDGQEVKVSKSKWNDLPYTIKLRAVIEESMVLAIERSLVPHPDVLTPAQAYLKALEKLSTSISSGWFREFCWENYTAAASAKNIPYWEKFQTALSKGLVLPHKELAVVKVPA
jgi:hypothetical protein